MSQEIMQEPQSQQPPVNQEHAEPHTPKFVQSYQATDEEGNPIGKPTNLTADTPEEMFDKMKQAHINATRALARQNKAFNELKAAKLTRTEEHVAPVLTPDEERNASVAIANPTTPPAEKKEAIRKLSGIGDLEQRVKVAEEAASFAKGREIGATFAYRHRLDYWPCDANNKAVFDWLKANNLDWTLDNLEIAFLTIGDDLAKKVPDAVNNPTNDDQSAPTSEQNHRRPGFGMQPGTGTGTRPVNNQPTGRMTKKDVIAKKKADPKWWKEVLQNPSKLAEINAILAKG